MESQTTAAHVAIVPAPGMGHLIPLVEFAKRLIHLPPPFNFSVTLLIPTTTSTLSPSQSSFLQSLPPSISHTVLPPVAFDDVQDIDIRIETRICLTVSRSLPSIRDAINSLTEAKILVAVVVDGFGTNVFDIAREFNASPYLYFGSGAMILSLLFCLPELDEKVSCEYRDMQEMVKIPGSIAMHGKDFLEPIQDRKNDAYKWILYHTRRCSLADGIMVNTFKKLEPETVEALQGAGKPPIYPIGPLVQMRSVQYFSGSVADDDISDHDCLKWLNDQPVGSVLYVSFGSGVTLSSDQLEELAMGLEMSKQRFLWVVRSPNEEAVNTAYFEHQKNDPFVFLPIGFLQRIKGRGFVVPNWAPQARILTHGSTGGFLTHCGWNSTLQSVAAGVPLIAWPLYAEQKMNAILLSEVLNVALRPKTSQNGLAQGVEIMSIVKNLMEGEEGRQLRSRMGDLKDAAQQELSPYGYSSRALLEVASKWVRKISSST